MSGNGAGLSWFVKSTIDCLRGGGRAQLSLRKKPSCMGMRVAAAYRLRVKIKRLCSLNGYGSAMDGGDEERGRRMVPLTRQP